MPGKPCVIKASTELEAYALPSFTDSKRLSPVDPAYMPTHSSSTVFFSRERSKASGSSQMKLSPASIRFWAAIDSTVAMKAS